MLKKLGSQWESNERSSSWCKCVPLARRAKQPAGEPARAPGHLPQACPCALRTPAVPPLVCARATPAPAHAPARTRTRLQAEARLRLGRRVRLPGHGRLVGGGAEVLAPGPGRQPAACMLPVAAARQARAPWDPGPPSRPGVPPTPPARTPAGPPRLPAACRGGSGARRGDLFSQFLLGLRDARSEAKPWVSFCKASGPRATPPTTEQQQGRLWRRRLVAGLGPPPHALYAACGVEHALRLAGPTAYPAACQLISQSTCPRRLAAAWTRTRWRR